MSVLHAQIFLFPKIRNYVLFAPSRLGKRGVRVVTNVGRDAVDAGSVARRAAVRADGEVVWSWRPDAGAKVAGLSRERRGQESPVPGESAI